MMVVSGGFDASLMVTVLSSEKFRLSYLMPGQDLHVTSNQIITRAGDGIKQVA